MSTVDDTPNRTVEASVSPTGNGPQTQRVLACVLCQQRKIRCDRKFPCATCIKSNVQCVPATLATRQRRRRFAERDLLDRLRHYESLLRANEVSFEPLHPPSMNAVPPNEVGKTPDVSELKAPSRRPSSAEPTIKTEPVFEAKYALR